MDWSIEYATKNDCTFEWVKCQVNKCFCTSIEIIISVCAMGGVS